MPYNVRLEFLQCKNLAFGVNGKQGYVLVGAYVKTKEGSLIFYGLDRSAKRGFLFP